MKFSSFIQHNVDAIVAEWESFARTLSPAEQMTGQALRDHCREMLLSVAHAMEQQETVAQRAAKSKGQVDADDSFETAATSHGSLRQTSGFDLVELVAEFRALRASVLALWQRSGPGAEGPALEELMRFNEAIDQALAESVESYSVNVDASRDMFLAILGHDLRAPLSGIAMANLLLGKPDLAQPARQQAVMRIKRATVEMGRLITDLLEYTRSRLGSGIPIERSCCDLASVCEEAIEAIRTSHPELSFVLRFSGDLRAEVDAARLQQVLSNLLHNAVQHGDRTEPISLQADGDEAGIVLAVCNRGVPIPADALSSIFDPLVQGPGHSASETDARSRTSLGLGLFIVRELVVAHRGKVGVDSSAESGTVFTVWLPRSAT